MDEEWDDNYEPEGEYDPERDGKVEPDPPEEPDDWSDAEESSDIIPEGEPIDAYSTEETRETWWRLASGGTPPTAPDTEDTTTTPTGWTMTRPTVTSDATAAMHAYECERTVYGDSSCLWGAVSMSVDYENEVKAWLAAKAANEANAVAGATAQHFWHDTDGVHVTDEEQDDWTTEYAKTNHGELGNPTSAKPWHNQLINSLGTLIRTGLRNLVSITQSAIAFYDGQGNATQNVTARFGASGAQIGKTSESRIELDYHSMKLVDKEESNYLFVSDLRNEQGVLSWADRWNTDGTTTRFYLSCEPIDSNYSVSVDGVEQTTGVSKARLYFELQTAIEPGHVITATYMTQDSKAKAFTFGTRYSNLPDNYSVGPMSVAMGSYVVASGITSNASGESTTASGNASHAEGRNTVASGEGSHAEGLGGTDWEPNNIASGTGSHAEGRFTEASGTAAHAEGSGFQIYGELSYAVDALIASGDYSHAQNLGTIAASEAQTAIGRLNIEDDEDTYAFIIGNGTAIDERSNAFAVDWDGNTDAAGALSLKNPSINRDNPGNSDVWDTAHCLGFCDADGERTGLVRCFQLSDGRVGITLLAVNEKTNGAEVYNALNIYAARDGTQTYNLTNPAAFRSAIGLARVTQLITANSGVASGGVRLIANAVMVTVNVNGLKLSSTLSSNSSIVIGNVPSAYRPYVSTFALVAPTSTAVGRLPLKIWVSATDGTVTLQNYTGSTVGTAQTIEATLTYAI